MEAKELEVLFRDNLRGLREDAGLSQSELARRISRPPGFICDFERCRRSPSLGTIALLAEGLGVSPAALLSTVRSRHRERISA